MKTVIAIGGGELRERTTLSIDEYIAKKAKAHAGEKRAYALFIPTASHDFMPYYNTFHKVYTGTFDIKTDVALTVFNTPDMEHIREKFQKADMIYVGGGDTVFMMEQWRKTGLIDLIREAYERGVVISGLSAGALCWFTDIFTDSLKTEDGTKYAMFKGLGWFEGTVSPHYNARKEEFDPIVAERFPYAYGLEDDSALIIEDGQVTGSLSSGGTVWKIVNANGKLTKEKI